MTTTHMILHIQKHITRQCSTSTKTLKTSIMDLKQIFLSGVNSVNPATLIRNSVSVITTPRGRHLLVNGTEFKINKPVHVVGFGKAVQLMAITLEEILSADIAGGVVTIPAGSKLGEASKIRFIEGARNNLPDPSAMQGAVAIRDLILPLQQDDLLVVLISGGGSALLPLPKEGIALNDKLLLIKDLANVGADIMELNTVRKKLSQLKGGGLARLAQPCRVVSLILSDIIGDPIDFIASGPTIRNTDDNLAAELVLDKYSLLTKQPDVIKSYLHEAQCNEMDLDRVSNFIIGSNKLATQAAVTEAVNQGCQHPLVLSHGINGDVRDLARVYAELCRVAAGVINKVRDLLELERFVRDNFGPNELKQELAHLERYCFILGGETTVVVNGDGLGGRNQQLVLEFAKEIHALRRDFIAGHIEVQFLSAGTDGIDGPTDAAGAIVDTLGLIPAAIEQNLDTEEALARNNCYEFFRDYRNGTCLIRTGHTGTNVMDLHLIVVYKKIN